MTTPLEIIREREREFDSHFRKTLISIAESEVERLEGMKHGYGSGDGYLIDRGFNLALQDSISHWKEILQELRK